MTRVSVVIPFLNEAESLSDLLKRLVDVGHKLTEVELEAVLVDDGSTDDSAQVLHWIAPRAGIPVRLVRLSRNFGSHAALAAGVKHATGDAVAFISADLQDPPEIIGTLVDRWRDGAEIVWATRSSRDDPWASRLLGWFYYVLLRRFALPTMPPGGVDLCLVDRQVIASLGDLQERNSNIFNMLMWAGFRQEFVSYVRSARQAGSTKWTMAKKIKLFIDSFIGFSFLPIRAISALGAVVSALGMAYAGLIILRKLTMGTAVEGWPSLMAAVLVLSGIQLLILGVMSEYLWRTLDAARHRPVYIVRDVQELSAVRAVEPIPPALRRVP